MPANVLSVVLCALAVSAQAQQVIFYEQDFQGDTFPPDGWISYSLSGADVWERSTKQARFGEASAYISYGYPQGDDWLITPAFTVSTGDELSFYLRTDFSGYSPDELSVRVSRTGSQPVDFADEILNLQEGVNYPLAGTWKQHIVSLADYAGETIRIGFHHTNEDGDGIFIDQVTLGSRPQIDARLYSIDTPELLVAGSIDPVVTVVNSGTLSRSFTVSLTTDDGYSSTRTTNVLATLETQQITFDPWVVEEGVSTLTATVELAGDELPGNNSLGKTMQVLPYFPHQGWSSQDALPVSKWASAVVGYSSVAGTENDRLMILGGITGDGNQTDEVLSYDPQTGEWSSLASAPNAVQQTQAVYAGGKVYLIGGYSSTFLPLTSGNLQIYDVATDSWSLGANMPFAVGDHAVARYQDSLLYVIGGYNGSSDVTNVQVYNTQTDEWLSATPFPGTPVAGVRAGIAKGKIVVVGGYNHSSNNQLSHAYVGEIGNDPTSISWTQVDNYPGGTLGRHAGASLGLSWHPYVYFTGGDPTGSGNQAKADTWAFNVESMNWEAGPDKLTASSNLMGLGSIIVDDVTYLAAVGGYSGSTFLAVNEWLALDATVSSALPRTFNLVPEGNTQPLVGNVSGGGEGCSIESAALIDPQDLASPPPAGVVFPYQLLTLDLQYCDEGASVDVEISFPDNLPAAAEYWKYGLLPGSEPAETGWYSIPLTINGDTASFQLVDGGQGDNDGLVNGFIQDPGGIAIVTNSGGGDGAGVVAVPTLHHWLLILLSLVLGGVGVRRLG